MVNKKCDLYCKINGACMHVHRVYKRPNKCDVSACPKDTDHCERPKSKTKGLA